MKKSAVLAVAFLLLSSGIGCELDDPRLNSDPLVQCMVQLKAHAADLSPENTPPEQLQPLRIILALGTAGAKNLARQHNSDTAYDEKYNEFLHQCQDIQESLGLRR
jgi:lipase chaperone LimK